MNQNLLKEQIVTLNLFFSCRDVLSHNIKKVLCETLFFNNFNYKYSYGSSSTNRNTKHQRTQNLYLQLIFDDLSKNHIRLFLFYKIL